MLQQSPDSDYYAHQEQFDVDLQQPQQKSHSDVLFQQRRMPLLFSLRMLLQPLLLAVIPELPSPLVQLFLLLMGLLPPKRG